MAGLLDAILPYLSSLANPTPQPQSVPQQPQGSPSPAAAPSPQSGGLLQGASSFLGNPLTQAALGGYFNAIGSPRLAGLGGRIKAGGLGALDAFNQAETAREQGPLNAAKIAAIQQQNALTGAQTGLTQQKAEQLAGIAPANAALAAQIHASEQFMTPDQARRAHILETAIANDTSKVYDPKEVFAQIYEEPLKEQQTVAQTAEAQARQKLTQAQTGAVPSEIGLRNAEAGRASAETAAIPARTALTEAETAAIPARTKLTEAEAAAIPARLKLEGERASATGSGRDIADWYDPITGAQYRGAQRKPTDRLISTLPKTPTTKPEDPATHAAKIANIRKELGKEYDDSLSFYAKRTMSTADYQAAKENYISAKMSEIGLSPSTLPATAGDPLSLIPPGATPGISDSGVHGYKTPDGVFHSVE